MSWSVPRPVHLCAEVCVKPNGSACFNHTRILKALPLLSLSMSVQALSHGAEARQMGEGSGGRKNKETSPWLGLGWRLLHSAFHICHLHTANLTLPPTGHCRSQSNHNITAVGISKLILFFHLFYHGIWFCDCFSLPASALISYSFFVPFFFVILGFFFKPILFEVDNCCFLI